MTSLDLGGGVVARPVSVAEYRAACARLEARIFGGNWLYAFGPPVKSPPPVGETFTFGLFHADEWVGWSHAVQLDERTVYMADTGIVPEFQGQGLYGRLLPHLLDVFREAGFTLVQSHHRATNNRVIIPKLRAGFVLQGLNLYEGGLNVALTLSLVEHYREAQHVRSGFKQASDEAARRLGVQPLNPSAAEKMVSHVPMPTVMGESVDLGGGYTLWPVFYDVYWSVYAALEDAAYESVSFDWCREAALPSVQLLKYAWLIEKDGEVAGWQYSRQWDSRTAYMVNTAFLPAHRGQGLYSRLLPVILQALKNEGYDVVRSHHHATNNAVIIPKLRAGFKIQGLHVDEHGVMAILNYSFAPVYSEYMDIRSGLKKPAGEAAGRIGLKST